ncbi:ribosome biogenesis GTP-binding protein YsxC [Metamycoplasma cloacale]|uniref:Probable GTP-binding protein EngB n=1 Tax=Metamycoplasma cloacale TaxID=92401 RepID=A0A2Z4LL95_9BACT|nr:ribosome biogenesis GTP-binding protein YihA/YsxC [Metamycoplasma cloacale]AWX42511.1 YihA family ribosome biogenesis GTP-binding protein [Metamycoplasma cloacale]VEU79143.1 ribosome biogenesis GTP-binding protein YsxC [Metamycoplasma cloacale]
MWKYIKSAADQLSWMVHDQPEIVFWGRSNVGKSSLINALANTKIAKTSSTPGRTKLINYFETNSKKILVDLPGYGYAALSKKVQTKIIGIIDHYFRFQTNEKRVCFLIDCKVGFTAIDLEMIEYIQSLGIKFDIFLTKCDKANQSQRYKTKNQALSFGSSVEVFMVSAIKNIGIEDINKFYEL